jgi:hypothetical protein
VDCGLTSFEREAADHIASLVGWIDGALPQITSGQAGVAA